jgi:signal transduction histidine kinase
MGAQWYAEAVGMTSPPSVARLLPQMLVQRLIEQSDDCIKVLSLEGRILGITQGGLRALEMDDFRPWQNSFWLDLWPEPHRSTAAQTLSAAAAGTASQFRGYCPTVKGTPKWWDVRLSPVPDTPRSHGRLIAVAQEVSATERRADLAELTTLRHEVRTALTVIRGEAQLLERRISASKTPETARWTRSTHAILAAVDQLRQQFDARLGRRERVGPL